MARPRNEIWEKEGRLVEHWMSIRNMVQADLAERTGLSRDVVANVIGGYTRMKADRKAKIAASLGVSVTDLTYDPLRPKELAGAGRIRSGGRATGDIAKGFSVTVAVRAWTGALASPLEEECYFEQSGFIEIPTAFLVGGFERADFHDVVTAAGVSMSPRIESGERVVIHDDINPRANTIVLAESPEHKVFLKVLRVRAGTFYLEAINPAVSPIEDLTGWKIHGYAVAILGDSTTGSRNIEWAEGKPLKVFA